MLLAVLHFLLDEDKPANNRYGGVARKP
jgi:hypothetical protein